MMASKSDLFVMFNYQQNDGVTYDPPPENAYVRNTCWHLFTGTILVFILLDVWH